VQRREEKRGERKGGGRREMKYVKIAHEIVSWKEEYCGKGKKMKKKNSMNPHKINETNREWTETRFRISLLL
jgi:hypothetical protein